MEQTTQNGAGNLDWVAHWREMIVAERAQAEALTAPGFARAADYWQPHAGAFAAAMHRQPQPDSYMQWLLPRLRPGDTVLDIGAGTGRHTAILAAHAAQVIALEPSAAMRAHLAARVADEGLGNVQVLADSWPPPQPIGADVVIATHVVYGVEEIAPFLRAMHGAARRLGALFLHIQPPGAVLAPLWRTLHGVDRLRLPGALEAVNVLHQLGIPARLDLLPAGPGGFHYPDEDAALADIRYRLRFAPDPAHDEMILNAVRQFFVHQPDGSLEPPGQPRLTAAVWWPTNET